MIPNCSYCNEQTKPERIFFTVNDGQRTYYCSNECATKALNGEQ
jgi:ribosomal protein L24E